MGGLTSGGCGVCRDKGGGSVTALELMQSFGWDGEDTRMQHVRAHHRPRQPARAPRPAHWGCRMWCGVAHASAVPRPRAPPRACFDSIYPRLSNVAACAATPRRDAACASRAEKSAARPEPALIPGWLCGATCAGGCRRRQ